MKILGYLSNSMPVDCDVFGMEAVLKLNDDGVTLVGVDCGTWRSAINGYGKFFKAIGGLQFGFYFPFIVQSS